MRPRLLRISALVFIASVPTLALAQRDSAVQFTKDGAATLVQKDFGTERWSITHRIQDGFTTGNVFFTDGNAPAFLSCERTAFSGGQMTFDCFSAMACEQEPCAGYESIGEVTLGEDFFFPENSLVTLTVEYEGAYMGNSTQRQPPCEWRCTESGEAFASVETTGGTGVARIRIPYTQTCPQSIGSDGTVCLFDEVNFTYSFDDIPVTMGRIDYHDPDRGGRIRGEVVGTLLELDISVSTPSRSFTGNGTAFLRALP